MSLPASPFMKTLILKHSTTPSPPNTRGNDVFSYQGEGGNGNQVRGGSLNRHLRKHAGHFKRNSLSNRKRSSLASSTGVVDGCDNRAGNSESSSINQQLSWRSSCGGLRKGWICHPRDIYQQSNYTTTDYPHHQQTRHPYMLSYSPTTYLEAHADRLPYVDDSKAVSPSMSELENSIPFLSTSASFNNQLPYSPYYCNKHQIYCNQSTLDHNHYHHYPNGTTSPPQCSSLNQQSSAHSTNNSASKMSQESKGHHDVQLNQEKALTQYTFIPHFDGQPSTLEAGRHSNYYNNSAILQPMPLQTELTINKYDLNTGLMKFSDKSGVVILNRGGGEVCNACLIASSDKKVFNCHPLDISNRLNVANFGNLNRDYNDLNIYGGGFRSRHNSYCSHASRWSYSSHVVDPIQNLHSPTSYLIETSARESLSHKSAIIHPTKRFNGAGHDDAVDDIG